MPTLTTMEQLQKLSGFDILNRMTNRLMFLMLTLTIGFLARCQSPNTYEVTSEKVVVKEAAWTILPDSRISYIGYNGNVLSLTSDDSESRTQFFLYDESLGKLSRDTSAPLAKSGKIVHAIRADDKFILSGFQSLPDTLIATPLLDFPIANFEYQDLWLSVRNKTEQLDRLPMHFIDKYYEIKFSNSFDEVICNAFTTRTAGYDSTSDGFFYIYRLSGSQRVHKTKFQCDRCMNTFSFDKKFVFQKDVAIGHGFDGEYHNIYEAPKDNVNDTLRIAHDIELKSISPDGQFILGTKYLHGKYCAILLNTVTKRFQYLLGRDYFNYPFFYSKVEKKFCFDIGTHLVYVEYPETYPFDALKSYRKRSTKEEDGKFWSEYDHRR